MGSIATVLAVVLALFLEQIETWRRRPRIELLFDSQSESYIRLLKPKGPPKGSVEGRYEVYLRIGVKNISRYTAREVELRLVRTTFGGNEERQNRPGWSFKASNLNQLRTTIHSYWTQYYDIAYSIYKPDNEDISAHLILCTLAMLEGREWPLVKEHIESRPEEIGLTIGAKHQIIFAVVGENIEAEYFRMELTAIKLETFSEDAFRQSLEASTPEKIDPSLAFDK